jgi:hypothetical protein
MLEDETMAEAVADAAGHSCDTCRWSGARPTPLGPRERLSVLSALPAGARVPSGRCPDCGGLVHPRQVANLTLMAAPAGELSEPGDEGDPWDLLIQQLGETLVIYLQHPDGHGFEALLDIQGSKPTLTLLPWDGALGLEELEPLASIKIGSDHVALRSARQAMGSAIACSAEGLRASLPLSRTQWSDLIDWHAEAALLRRSAQPASCPASRQDRGAA